METELYIKSDLFPAYPNEEDDSNPGRFGKKLAEFVKETLEKNSIQVADLYPTDYAYELRLDQFKFKLYIQTGNIDGETDQFLVSIEPKKEFVRKLFKKISTKEAIGSIYSILHTSFHESPDIEILQP